MLQKIWQQLQSVKHLNRKINFEYGGLTGKLKGNVQVEQISDTELIFHEHGLWESKDHRPLAMSNTYHWQLIKNQISLSHLRYGKYSPVFLVDFQPFICNRFKLLQNLLLTAQETLLPFKQATTVSDFKTRLIGKQAHFCAKDIYNATLELNNQQAKLHWEISGPNKLGTIVTYYY